MNMTGKIFMIGILICAIGTLRQTAAFGACEKELAGLEMAEKNYGGAATELNDRMIDMIEAENDLYRAQCDLVDVARALGVTVKLSGTRALFGKDSKGGNSFLNNPKFIAAKKKWLEAKKGYEEAQKDALEAQKMVDSFKRDVEYAREEYDTCMLNQPKKPAEDTEAADILDGWWRNLAVEPAKWPDEPPPWEPQKPKEKAKEEGEKEKEEINIIYDAAKKDDVSCDVGYVLTETKDRKTLEVSVLTTGRGAEFRRWEPLKVCLETGSGILKPQKIDNFYTAKESFARGAATVVFAAIGSQYKEHAAAASQCKGTPCEVSQPSCAAGKGAVSTGIDRAGTTAGMGLLVSQAKGEIKGLRLTFDVTGRGKELKNAKLKVTASNKEMHKEENFVMPVAFK